MAKRGSAPSTMAKDDNRDDVAATKDSLIVNQTREGFEELHRLRMKLIYAFVQWIPIRQRTIKRLEELATKLHEHHRNVNIATVTGTSMCTVGSILSAAGLITAPFTFGAGIIVSLVGAGIGGTGGLAMSGSKVVEKILEKLRLKDVQLAIDEDHTACVELEQQLDSLKDFISQLAELLNSLKTPLPDDALLLRELEGNGFQFLRARIFSNVIGSSTKERVDISAKFFRAVSAAAPLSTSAIATARAVARTAAMAGTRVAHYVGSAISFVILPFDVVLLVRSSLELHRGSTSSAVEEIRQRLSDLRCPDVEEIQGLVKSFIDDKFNEAYNKMNDKTNKENGVGDV
ncbi:apolipoprotein L3-like [Montipora capricornis]|uniref:apolipoprotein L3-like n=1 Tax=Montipora capricornis TaxID=246305 RepID=UPI0035F15AA2